MLRAVYTVHVYHLDLQVCYLNAGSQQSFGKLCGIVQRGTSVSGAMQQQHWRHEVSVAGPMHHIGRGQRLQLSLALEVHDAVEQGVVQAPLVEVLPQVCTVVDAGDAHQAPDLGGIPSGGAPKNVLPAGGNLSL